MDDALAVLPGNPYFGGATRLGHGRRSAGVGVSKGRDGHVYIVCHKDGESLVGPVKVGITYNVKSRLKSLQTGNPRQLVVFNYLVVPGKDIARDLEEGFHHTQREHRLAGEWFDIDPTKANFILHLILSVAFHYKAGFDRDEADEAIQVSCGRCEICKFKLGA